MVAVGSHERPLFKICGDSALKNPHDPRKAEQNKMTSSYLQKTQQYHHLFEERAPKQNHYTQEKLAFDKFSQGNLKQGAWKSDKMSESE